MRFTYHLARELGLTVGELHARMSADELTYWRALFLIEEAEAKRASMDSKAMDAAKAARASKTAKPGKK